MSSSRFPEKSMKILYDKPLVYYVFDRMKRVSCADTIVLATSDDSSDDVLAAFAESVGINVFRGDLLNVQKRFYDAARAHSIDVIIRVTGDNPLISPVLVTRLCDVWDEKEPDYVSYSRCTLGTGAELFTFGSFENVVQNTSSDYGREHVTPRYYQTQGMYRLIPLDAPDELFCPGLRLTVDTEDDFIFMQRIYEEYIKNGFVPLSDVIQGECDVEKKSTDRE